MIELNLIPDVKREFIRAKQQQAVVVTVSILVGVAAIALLAVLGLVIGTQAVISNHYDDTIKNNYAKLQKVTGLPSLLTIQQQLDKLPDQNASRPIDSRIFDVLNAVNPPSPNNVSFTTIKIDPTTSTVSLEGSAQGGYAATDTLKKTILNSSFEYNNPEGDQKVPLTDNVSILDTHYTSDDNDNSVLQFSIQFVYASDLFANNITNAHIVGPQGQIDVTDSKTHVPSNLLTTKSKNAEAQ